MPQKHSHEHIGTIVAHYGQTAEVDDVHRHRTLCSLRKQLPTVITGDQVVFQVTTTGAGIITAALPRTSLFGRLNRQGAVKSIAANVDHILLTLAVQPKASLQLIDRYLASAQFLGIEASIIYNKTDLLPSAKLQNAQQQLQHYVSMGYDMHFTSTASQQGLAALQRYVAQKTSVVVGQSGTGKSSLIKWLVEADDIRIGQLSTASQKGKHTTTTARLYYLSGGGRLIDSPGIRGFLYTTFGCTSTWTSFY